MADNATPGTNGIRPDEYLGIIRELVADEIEKNKVVGRIRAKLKRLKDAGANLDAVALLRKLSKRDPEERLAMLADLRKYAGWEGVTLIRPGVDPDAVQDEMFDEPSPEMKQKYREALIHGDGYNSRRAGGSRDDNPQVAGSGEFQMWDRGWLDCDGDLSAQGQTARVGSTERRPRAKRSKNATGALNDEIARTLTDAGVDVEDGADPASVH
jgi:hypothetical protein